MLRSRTWRIRHVWEQLDRSGGEPSLRNGGSVHRRFVWRGGLASRGNRIRRDLPVLGRKLGEGHLHNVYLLMAKNIDSNFAGYRGHILSRSCFCPVAATGMEENGLNV